MSDDPIPAATLIVVREHGRGGAPELLMVERARGMAFAGGALVFPGGRIDEADRLFASAISGGDAAARVAAIRETIEETAIPVGFAPTPSPDAALSTQHGLVSGRSFADLLAEQRLRLCPEALTPFARWVPRFHASRRFDTLFFIAAAPEVDWQPNAVESECAGAFWVGAADVLERDRRGDARLIFPTRRTLERLAQHSTLAAILADARAHPVEPITPWVEERDGERYVAIPEHIGYPVTSEKLDGLWRG